jgi:acyl-CoA synthetase (AMP-forming)/AMP-acid ligase II
MTSYSTIDDTFREVVGRLSDQIAIVDGATWLSYGDLEDRVARVANGLATLGLRKGDRLAIWMPNSIEWAVTFFAAARLGAVVVPINTGLSIDEAQYQLSQSGAQALIVERSFRNRDYLRDAIELRKNLEGTELELIVVGDPADQGVSWDLLAASAPLVAAVAPVAADDPCIILYTSGTTGQPKGAVHTHRFLAPLMSVSERLDIGRSDSVVLYLPMYHVYGLLAGLVMILLSGAKVVVMKQFDAVQSLSLIETEGATIVFGVPTTYIDQLAVADIDDYNLSTVRASFTPFPEDLSFRVSDRFGVCLNTYGMTETASVAFLASLDDPLEIAIRSVGYPVDGLEAQIVDPETAQALPTGEVGALQLRGPSIMTHYFEKPEETTKAKTSDGWFRTGDLGSFDDAGRLTFHGRQSDQLRVGGEMVDPVEIEMAFQSHPTVERAAVAGVVDERLGQVPYAWVQLKEGARTDPAILTDHVSERLAWFKRPRRTILVDALPTTPSGKVQKFVLLQHLDAADEP